jgi:hypothetical protein
MGAIEDDFTVRKTQGSCLISYILFFSVFYPLVPIYFCSDICLFIEQCLFLLVTPDRVYYSKFSVRIISANSSDYVT